MDHYICVQCFMTETSSVWNVYTLTLFPSAIPFPKIETEDYLQKSIGNILAILSKPKTQIPFLTYGDITTSAVESIANILQCAIPCAPLDIPNPNPTPTPKHTTPVPEKLPMNVLAISPTMPHCSSPISEGTHSHPCYYPCPSSESAPQIPRGYNYPFQKIHSSATCSL